MKVTAELLEIAGYTETQVDRFYKLLNRKQNHGLAALTVADRRFYIQAQTDAAKAQKYQLDLLVAAKKRVLTGKQPVETKLHYRWVEADLVTINRVVETLPGEVSAFAIIKEETLAALRKYQPVLDQVDTSKRFKFVPVERDLLALAAVFGRVATFDKACYLETLQTEFVDSWQESWTLGMDSNGYQYGAVISVLDESEFRDEVRAQIESITREAYPSVNAIV